MEYKAIVKRKSDDELQHWKYLRREKVGDKYKYYYETDTNGLHVGKTTKSKSTINAFGKKIDLYTVNSPETFNKDVPVTKEIYDKTRAGSKLYVGRQPLSKITKEQVSVAKSFVNDLFAGRIYREKKNK